MSAERVHLFDLRERTSAAGNRYLSGWLGKARVVAFLDREADDPTWNVYLQSPQAKQSAAPATADKRYPVSRAARRAPGKRALPAGELDDRLDDL